MSVDAVRAYYDECHTDYRFIWRSHKNLCIHYGFHDAEHPGHHEALVNMNRVMCRRAAIRKGDQVLDAGCGIGGSAIFVAEETGASVCGVNIQPLHLGLARAEAERRGLTHLVRFEERNYCRTGLAPESFDVVWALESVCHSDSKQAFVNEAFRVLRRGGRLVVGDFVQFKKNLSNRQQRHMRNWLDGWALPHLAGFDEFREMMRLAGFDKIQADDITPNVLHSAARLFIASLPAIPIGLIGQMLGLRTARQTANVKASFFQYTTIKEGLWGYAIYTAVKPA